MLNRLTNNDLLLLLGGQSSNTSGCDRAAIRAFELAALPMDALHNKRALNRLAFVPYNQSDSGKVKPDTVGSQPPSHWVYLVVSS